MEVRPDCQGLWLARAGWGGLNAQNPVPEPIATNCGPPTRYVIGDAFQSWLLENARGACLCPELRLAVNGCSTRCSGSVMRRFRMPARTRLPTLQRLNKGSSTSAGAGRGLLGLGVVLGHVGSAPSRWPAVADGKAMPIARVGCGCS